MQDPRGEQSTREASEQVDEAPGTERQIPKDALLVDFVKRRKIRKKWLKKYCVIIFDNIMSCMVFSAIEWMNGLMNAIFYWMNVLTDWMNGLMNVIFYWMNVLTEWMNGLLNVSYFWMNDNFFFKYMHWIWGIESDVRRARGHKSFHLHMVGLIQ